MFFYFHLQFSQLRPAFYKSAGTSFSENKAKLYRKSCPSVRQTVHIGCYLGYEDKKALHIHTITGQIDMFPDRALSVKRLPRSLASDGQTSLQFVL